MPSRVTQDVTDRVLSTYVVTMDQFYTCHHAICLLRLIDYICSHIYPFFYVFHHPIYVLRERNLSHELLKCWHEYLYSEQEEFAANQPKSIL